MFNVRRVIVGRSATQPSLVGISMEIPVEGGFHVLHIDGQGEAGKSSFPVVNRYVQVSGTLNVPAHLSMYGQCLSTVLLSEVSMDGNMSYNSTLQLGFGHEVMGSWLRIPLNDACVFSDWRSGYEIRTIDSTLRAGGFLNMDLAY